MSIPNVNLPKPAPQNVVIAGKACGIRVKCVPGVLGDYKKLETLSSSGNHWARLIIKGIGELSSGRLHMDNVFTKSGPGIAYNRGVFFVSLPGVFATFEDLGDGSYLLTHLKADDAYFENQKLFKNPGLWKVMKQGEHWIPEFVENSRISKKEMNPYVVISDRGFTSPSDAAAYASASLESVNGTVKRLISKQGFHIHFTPGKAQIGGYRNCLEALKAETRESLRASSQLLAYTMHEAREIENVQWFSDWGGSGVLTQAMRILADQKVNLSNHTILLNHPTTRPSVALNLARQLNLEPFEKGQIKSSSPSELVGRLVVLDSIVSAFQRLKSDPTYKTQHIALDAGKNAAGVSNFVVGGIGALGAVGLVGGAIAGAPVVAGAGAAFFVFGAIKGTYNALKPRNRN